MASTSLDLNDDAAFHALILGDGNFSFSLALARMIWPPLDGPFRNGARPALSSSPSPSTVSETSTTTTTTTATTAATHESRQRASAIARAYLGVPDHIPSESITLVTTSFDTREQLLQKYPESKDILQHLEEDSRLARHVKVLHGINAWELASHFKPAAAEAEEPSTSGPQEPFWVKGRRADGTVGFDAIAWNHPHLGTEDFRLHRFLMAHFFRSVADVLRQPRFATTDTDASDAARVPLHPGGCVVVSLVRGQETRWNLVHEAIRSDLGLTRDSPFLFEESNWDGYVVKRNKHGRSFKNEQTRKHVGTDMRSHGFRFVFGRLGGNAAAVEAAEVPAVDESRGVILKPDVAQELIAEKLAATLKLSSKKAIETPLESVPAPASEKSIPADQPSKEQPSQSGPTAESLSKPAPLKNPNISRKELRKSAVPADLKCPHCSKQLTSARAYQQHVHQVHVLKLFGDSWVPDREATIPCGAEGCTKMFTSENARWQHHVNKHSVVAAGELPPAIGGEEAGTGADLAPDEDDDGEGYGYVPCHVCGQAVARRPWGMRLHLETLKPALGLDMGCPLCPSTFIERRALFQHFKFCRLKRGHAAVAAAFGTGASN
ncbi:hypothetical protein HDU96_010695 [Phlyctochytrium bullatum]|nr:hypothetical protein HDU96_010695 [Phlyctochytrium bullatum]